MADSHASTSHAPAATAGHGHEPGHDDAAHVAKHIKGYLVVGALLFVLTGVTVGLSYVDFGSHAGNFIVGMIVASIKAGAVAAIFMHLKGERITIWRFLLFTTIFVLGLFLLSLLHNVDPIPGTLHNHH